MSSGVVDGTRRDAHTLVSVGRGPRGLLARDWGGTVKFGLFYPFQLPRPWREGAEQRLFLEGLEQVELGDRVGVEYCWGQEHDFLEEYCHSSAPEVYLGAFSQRTKRMRIGHGIIHMPPRFNHPARVAERLATLDLVSGGRAEWGAGEASTRLELEAFGVPYVEKRAMWEEAVREVARMFCLEPYPGYEGKYFSFPARNIVPKPVQKPHPPLWMACTNRASLRHAARNGIGALTFAFMDAREAKFWVQDYYDTFRRECVPLGRAVNPNVAMLTQFMCHRDSDTARRRGLEGARFFAFALSHYYRTGTHVPGRVNLWEEFQKRPPFAMAGTLGIGTPQEIGEHFRGFEEAGVDQLILLHQAGNYEHEHICRSLELFGAELLPEFRARDEVAARRKAAALEADVERALARIPPLEEVGEVRPVECYQVVTERLGANPAQLQQDRAPLPATFWRLHVGGPKGRTGTEP